MRGYRVKRKKRSFEVQVRFLLFWRTLAVYQYTANRFFHSVNRAEKEANAIASELIKRSN